MPDSRKLATHDMRSPEEFGETVTRDYLLLLIPVEMVGDGMFGQSVRRRGIVLPIGGDHKTPERGGKLRTIDVFPMLARRGHVLDSNPRASLTPRLSFKSGRAEVCQRGEAFWPFGGQASRWKRSPIGQL